MNAPEGPRPEAKNHIAEIMQSEVDSRRAVAEVEKERELRRSRKRLPLLLILAPITTLLTVWNFVRVQEPDRVFDRDRELAGARYTLFLTASAIESFRDSAGFLPLDLEQVGMDEDDVVYVQSGSEYALSVQLEGDTVNYTSGEDLDPYERAFAGATEGVPR